MIVGLPFHEIMLGPYFCVGLIGLEQEEMDRLVKYLGAVSELVFDLAHLALQFDPAHTSLLSDFSHGRGDFILIFLDQSLWQATDTSLVAAQ